MKHFLLLDDEHIFNFLTRKKIELSGFKGEIDVFTSAEDLLKFLRHAVIAENTDYILLLDIRMPEINGFQFLDQMAALPEKVLKEIGVYILTSSIDRRDYEKAFSYRFVMGFFSKPLDDESLSKILEIRN